MTWKHSKEYMANWRKKSHKLCMLAGAKLRAKKRGLEFVLTKDDIEIPVNCPILGIPIERNIGSGFHNSSPSLDRINNKLGYTKDNVRVISNRANLLKCDATLEELELIYKDALLHRY